MSILPGVDPGKQRFGGKGRVPEESLGASVEREPQIRGGEAVDTEEPWAPTGRQER